MLELVILVHESCQYEAEFEYDLFPRAKIKTVVRLHCDGVLALTLLPRSCVFEYTSFETMQKGMQ